MKRLNPLLSSDCQLSRWVRWVLITALVSMAQGVHAQVPSGTAPCGVPIFVYQTGMGGFSTLYNGQAIIVLDPQVAAGDPQFREFTVYHECGHHVNGDILPHGFQNPQGLRPEQELQADCYAAEHVANSVSRHAAEVFRATQGPYSPAPGYPTGNARASNILRCAGLSDEGNEGDSSEGSRRSSRCPGLPPGMSLTCRFTRGPRAGQVQDFCGTGARPAPVGGSCTDGFASSGVAQ